ncbi:hypothetical protein [Pseudorhodobacter sp.]|uniref:hypothetical protein n=1 Tax=Pseudorhodobacter sp. TaxID=1934400 RepID=UPI002647CF5A|nr:hypothetical protein [Pseudorhodobacter sp.]MDN5785715.1 hypothetical protein [Pseudorhodobacter sp.]
MGGGAGGGVGCRVPTVAPAPLGPETLDGIGISISRVGCLVPTPKPGFGSREGGFLSVIRIVLDWWLQLGMKLSGDVVASPGSASIAPLEMACKA